MVSQWVRFIDRVIIRECIRLARLGHVRIDAQELIGRRVVVAVNPVRELCTILRHTTRVFGG
jgi:hypothetical protein